MQLHPLGCAQAGLDRVPKQEVHESVLAGRRGGLDQAGGRCLIKLAQAAQHRLPHHPGEHLDGEHPADDRRRAQQPHGLRREPFQSFVDRLLHARWDRDRRRSWACADQRPAHLTDEEGVVTGDRVHPLNLRWCVVAPDQRGELLADGNRAGE